MKREEALAIWAPDESPWRPWAKGVLFAFMPEEFAGVALVGESAWQVPLVAEMAFVVELAGDEGARVGMELAHSGYRPVPVYNACPAPFAAAGRMADETEAGAVPCAVNVEPIRQALQDHSAALGGLALPPSAPPAFLLDANRQGRRVFGLGQWFDNRSVVRAWDFPPAAFLQAQGIRQVVWVREEPEASRDLREVLRAWQAGGLTLAWQEPGKAWNPQIFRVSKPSFLARWLDRFFLWTQPRNDLGSFGRFVNDAGG